ncbi:MAG: hypothetical protein FWH21_07335 [Kiritimatiellaeota bacterium]|nr:hypothetical protein [Kiritimatiellota bacterium]
MRRVWRAALSAVIMASAFSGCIKAKVETTHEIKPIQITLDINLKLQKELEDFLDLD